MTFIRTYWSIYVYYSQILWYSLVCYIVLLPAEVLPAEVVLWLVTKNTTSEGRDIKNTREYENLYIAILINLSMKSMYAQLYKLETNPYILVNI